MSSAYGVTPGLTKLGLISVTSPRGVCAVGVILGGLLPLLFADGPGVDLMRPIAAPLVGGMLTAPLFSLFVVPVIYRLVIRRSVPAAADSVTSVTL